MEHTTYRSKKGVCTMAVDFSKSKTRENLMRAFAGESQARNRYTIAAKQASRDNLYSISQIFLFTADQERAHAEVFYELLRGQTEQTIEICGGYPVNLAENVTDLLKSAVHNEMQEFEDVYPEFAKIAKEEGFDQASGAFDKIDTQIAGLGEISAIQDLYVAHSKAAIDGKSASTAN